MKFVNLASSNIKVSQIGLGTWQLGSREWGYGEEYNRETAIKIIHKALELGINLIDTAEIYAGGESERIIGEAIKEHDRESIVITSKFFPRAIRPSSVVKALKKSLNRLQTSYIDIYLIHWPLPTPPIGRTLRHMEKMVDEGLIRFVGVSNFSRKRLQRAQSVMLKHKVEVNQVNYSMVRNTIEKDLLHYARSEKKLIMAYSPLAQGWLTGKYSADKPRPKGIRRLNRLFTKKNLLRGEPLLNTLREIAQEKQITMAQLALSWTIRDPTVVAIPGAKSVTQLEDNTKAADFQLSDDDIQRINIALAKFNPKLVQANR
ncbi:MAG: aldo/keto reductase [Promethearchaeota archaeon]